MSVTFGNPGAPSQATINYDALFTSSLANYKKTLEDNIATSTPLFYKIKSSKAWQSYPGGTHLKIPLMYELQTADTFAGYDLLNTDPVDGLTNAIWQWSRAAIPIAISKDEETDNTEPAQIVPLLGSKIKQAELGFKDFFNKMILQGNGINGGDVDDPYVSPNNGSLGVEPLAKLIAVDPTASLSVGNIDQSSHAWWRNQTEDFSTVTTTTGLLQKFMTLINNCRKGTGGGDLICVTDQTTYEWLIIAIYHRTRHDPQETANFPFQNFKYQGVTFTWDEHMIDAANNGTDATASGAEGTAYMLNMDYFMMKYHPQMNFTNEPFQTPVGQAAKVSQIFWKGQLCISNRRKHGVGHGIPRTFTIS